MTDYAYETLAAETMTDMNAGRGELNRALKDIRDQCVLRNESLASEIQARAAVYRRLMSGAVLTPTALAKHWLRCQPSSLPSQETNRTAHVDCETCGGDRFVTYSMRRPEQPVWMRERDIEPHYDRLIEESAPCPDCNPVEYRGAPNPAQVRERLRA